MLPKIKGNNKKPHCIYGTHYNVTSYWHEQDEKWYKCRSAYCRIHGNNRREDLAERWSYVLNKYPHHHYLTVHFGEVTSRTAGRKAKARFLQIIRRLNIPMRICSVPHWHIGDKNRHQVYCHWHICISADEIISRKTLKDLLTKAAKEHKCNNPSRIRMGYKLKEEATSFTVYAFCIKRYKRDLVLPPYGVRRDFVRRPRKTKSKIIDCQADGELKVSKKEEKCREKMQKKQPHADKYHYDLTYPWNAPSPGWAARGAWLRIVNIGPNRAKP